MDICGTGKGLSREIYPERIFDYYNESEESFIGNGEMGKIATSAARAGSMLTKYISDKDWLDTLFSVYDRDERGCVQSSKLMELVKFTMSGNYEELEMMLDPMGCDLPVDMETFRAIMNTWESKNGSSPDPSLLSSEISQLEFVNKKLVGENSKLELQVMNIEDQNNHLRKEIETLHNRIHTLQNNLQDYQDELKRTQQKLEEENTVRQYEFDQLKAIKLALEQEIKEIKDELTNANTEISTLRGSEETLLNTSQEQEKLLFDAATKAAYYEEHYNQKLEEWQDIKEKFLDVLRSNEQLRREKRELEEEFMKIQELQCIQEMRTTLDQIQGSEDENEEEEKDEGIPESLQLLEQDEENELEDDSIHDITMDAPLGVSTPLTSLEFSKFDHHNSSLFAELVDSVSDDSFGQPMCGKRPKLQLDLNRTLNYPVTSNNDIHGILETIQEVQCVISRVNADLVEKYKLQGALITSDKMTPKNLEQTAASQESHAEKKLVQAISMDLPDKCNVELHDILSIDMEEFDLESELSNAENMLTTSLNNSADSVKDQFSKELKILRMQIAKSQAILTALSKTHKISRHGTTSQRKRKIFHPSNRGQNAIADIKAELLEYSPDRGLLTSRLGILANSHFNRYSTPATSGSQNSTPLHSHVRAKSCPILPSQTSLVTTGTQTEPLDTHIFLFKEEPTVTKPVLVGKPNGSRQWKAEMLGSGEEDSLPQPYRRPKLSIPAIVAISDSEEVLSSPEVIRNRSSSFMKAIKHGSSALIQDTASGSTEPSATLEEQSPTPPDEERVPNGEEAIELAADPPQSAEDSDDYMDLEEGISTSEKAAAKKTSTGEGERQRKTGLNSIGKESQLKVLISSKSEKTEDDEDDDAWRAAALVGSRRRRRGSTGSPGSSPAIQRSKAVDFGELESVIPSELGPQPKDSDTDVDIKRDILEGMTQVATRTPSIPDHPNRSLSLSESRELKVRRRPTDSKARPLMPDLMENSETESAKCSGGSLESETESAPSTAASTTPPPPPASGEPSFPSIPDSFLKKLGLHKTSAERTEHLSEQEVENKFTSLSLAFKTDRFTLAKRLEIQQRQRDLAEKNVEEEIQALKENLNALSHVCCTEETRELVKRLHHHLEVLHQSTTRMSSRAEVYGAVQQEERMSKAIEVMVLYVENLKRLHDRTSQDLEDMKRIMIENNLLTEDGSEAEDGRRSFRTFSLSSVTGRPGSRRRASIAALPRGSADRAEAKSKFMTMMTTAASRNSTCSIGGRRCSLIHNLRPFASAESTPTGEKPRATDDCLPLSHSLDSSPCEESAVPRLTPCDVSSLPECQQQSPVTPPTQDQTQLETNCSEGSKGTAAEPQHRTDDKIEPNNNNSRDVSDGTIEDEKRLHWSQVHRYQNPYDPSDHEDEDEVDEEEEDEMVSVKKLMQACPRKTSTHSPTSLFNSIPWMDNSCHLLRGFRYTVGGILLIAALLSLIVTFMPGQAIAQCRVSSWQSWHSLEEILQPYIALHHRSSPAT